MTLACNNKLLCASNSCNLDSFSFIYCLNLISADFPLLYFCSITISFLIQFCINAIFHCVNHILTILNPCILSNRLLRLISGFDLLPSLTISSKLLTSFSLFKLLPTKYAFLKTPDGTSLKALMLVSSTLTCCLILFSGSIISYQPFLYRWCLLYYHHALCLLC